MILWALSTIRKSIRKMRSLEQYLARVKQQIPEFPPPPKPIHLFRLRPITAILMGFPFASPKRPFRCCYAEDEDPQGNQEAVSPDGDRQGEAPPMRHEPSRQPHVQKASPQPARDCHYAQGIHRPDSASLGASVVILGPHSPTPFARGHLNTWAFPGASFVLLEGISLHAYHQRSRSHQSP